MSIELFGITWGMVEYLMFLVPLTVIIFYWLWVRFYRTRRTAITLAGNFSTTFLDGFSIRRQFFRLMFTGVGVLLLSLALLRPQWDEKEEIVVHEGRDVLIALDISRSMLATDCKPSRLLCAKAKIRNLLSVLSCERVGLILFSGSALVQCPFTADKDAFNMFLGLVETESISSGTTAIDSALQKALHTFKRTPEKKSRLLVLFTDGEDFSHNLSSIKQEAQKEGLTIVTVGVGTGDGAPVPLLDHTGKQKGHQMDNKGTVIISRLNEAFLQALPRDVGGIYVPLTQDGADLDTIVQYVQSFEKERIEDRNISRLHDQYPLFLLGSFVCFALEWLL